MFWNCLPNDNSGAIVIGSGYTIKQCKDRLLKFIGKNKVATIGVNAMTDLCIPDYHIWTNKKQYSELGQCVNDKSQLILGSGIPDKVIRKYPGRKFWNLNFIDRDDLEIKVYKKTIYGRFRTAGVLAIMVAHQMGANRIYVAGMDGYTLHAEKDLRKGEKSHHCYGDGYTDDADWEKCKEKDEIVDSSLKSLRKWGVEFEIITPTKFEDFYNPLCLNE